MVTSPFIRNSPFGQLVYHISGKKYFRHPEELPGYVPPERYTIGSQSASTAQSIDEKDKDLAAAADGLEPVEKVSTTEKHEEPPADDYIRVSWDGDDDPENPYNWPLNQRVLFLSLVGFLTVSIYMGASIYTPGFRDIQEQFHVSQTVSILPLSVFVMGYGIGPMIFSPLSEHPAIGRTWIYVTTLFIYVILQIPTALAKNIGSMIVLRFLAGFFASPALATGGASVGDVIHMPHMPIGLAGWALSAVCGPVLGPLIGGVLVQEASWRWTFWFLLIMGGTVCAVLFVFLPESSTQTLLYRKAQRLRKLTGNDKIVSEGQLRVEAMSAKELAIDTLYRPIEITLTEPIVFFINLYIALVYSVFYTFFEAFPIVFEGVFHFNTIELGVSYVSVIIGVLVGCSIYITLIHHRFTKKLLAGTMVQPEVFLPVAILGSLFMPIGLFIFAWSATESSHWIAPLIGALTFTIGGFMIFQTLFNYLAFSFPVYMASVFASNGLFRAGLACAFPLFANQMYSKLGPKKFPVGWGCTLLALLATAMILIPVTLNWKGVKLRARSKYAA